MDYMAILGVAVIILATIVFGILGFIASNPYSAQARIETLDGHILFNQSKLPVVKDENLNSELVFRGLKFPTNMEFLSNDEIVVLEKNQGSVVRIINQSIVAEPLLEMDVLNSSERGLLGIESAPTTDKTHRYVGHSSMTLFLYMTEADIETNEIFNRLYRYQLTEGKITDSQLILQIPGQPGPRHNGGEILNSPDGKLYLVVGSVNGNLNQAANHEPGSPDGRSGILHFTQEGKPTGEGILGTEYPSNLYYAYGIRNSFGMDFDPITGYLWDTENGERSNDEINLVRPGFNSGWTRVQGMPEEQFDADDLVDFGGRGEYSDPEFIWNNTVGPTALKFLHSDKLGKEYENDMFVADFNNGNIYRFDLNDDRTELLLNGPLKDGIANSHQELKEIIFASGFGPITDLQVGPDGYLYVLSLNAASENCDTRISFAKCLQHNSDTLGAIFRIIPAES
jgi:glucose/arabinose dehydrogenase